MSILIKVIILLFFGAIFFALGSSLFYLITGKPKSDRIVKALSWRIGLSFVLFIILMIAFALGLIHPHSIT